MGIDVRAREIYVAVPGRDLSAFLTAGDFASWLGLCPDHRITGGKVLSTRTRKVKHPLATALRLAAQSLHHSRSRPRRQATALGYTLVPVQASS